MTYTVEILRTAQDQLAKIAKQDRGRIIAAIRALALPLGLMAAKSYPDVRLGEFGSERTESSTRFTMNASLSLS